MSAAQLALLAGLLLGPLAALWLGHRLREGGPRRRSVFVGVLTGYCAGTLVMLWAALVPPVSWASGDWRELAVHWAALVGCALGAAVGAVVPPRQRLTGPRGRRG